MESLNKTALRAAVLIREQLSDGPRHEQPLYLPEYSWNNIHQLRRQIDRAHDRGWHRAAARLTEDLADAVGECRRQLENASRVLESRPSKPKASSVSDVYHDIVALDNEFEEVDMDIAEHTLSVTTDRIVLDYVHLGRFEIKLDWRRLGDSQPYRVVALDPNPAAKSEDITHPHVQDEQLCEGEGRTAIQAALAEGRLYDFYLLVSQTLHTYAQGSAYVELDAWDGTPCDECGDSTNEENRYCCDHCGSTLCVNCVITCHACYGSFCSDCIGPCCRCGRDYCSSCLAKCPVCHKQFCEDCREGGLCLACHQKQRNQETENDSPSNDTIGQPAGRSPTTPRRRSTSVPA